MDKKSISHIKIAFIVCMGRSGSTLLQHVLDSHPQIVSPLESRFVLQLKSDYQYTTHWNDRVISRFIKDLYTNHMFVWYWKVEKETLKSLFDTYAVDSFADACKIVYLSYQPLPVKNDVHLIVDKNPVHSLFIPELKAIFSQADFIYLYRDPRAVIRSQKKALKKKNTVRLATQWNLMNTAIIQNCSPVHKINYEAFTENPETEIKSLFEKLDLTFKPEVLHNQEQFSQKAQSQGSFLSYSAHQNVLTPINNKHQEKWKKDLSQEDIEIIETLCFDKASALGYKFQKHELQPFIYAKVKKWKKRQTNWCNVLKTWYDTPLYKRRPALHSLHLIKSIYKKYRLSKRND